MKVGEAVAQRILDLCQTRNISINKLCTISGVTQSTINNIVSGRNASTTVATVKKLCDGLEITLGQFFSTPEFDGLEQEIQ
ncbi:helix-turn-helix domain-containing protein [Oscillospiraceae bacterium 42-9]